MGAVESFCNSCSNIDSENSEQTFARWQPIYQKYGIPTFPVRITPDEKKPLVKGFLETTQEKSEELVKRYGSATAFGYACGEHSGITLIDVDSEDESALHEARQIFGTSPMLIRTGGKGGFQMPFRYNGERRQIKPIKGLPIDILGSGGYVVAPPSAGTKRQYGIVEGSLDDLERLPIARIPESLLTSKPKQKPERDLVEVEGLPELAESPPLASGMIREGRRHNAVLRHLHRAAWEADSLDSLALIGRRFNRENCFPPLPDGEVYDIARWCFEKREEGRLFRPGARNWLDDFKELVLEDRSAACLLGTLRAYCRNRDRPFVVANAFAKTLRMDKRVFRRSRNKLIERGHIIQIRPETAKTPAVFKWPENPRSYPDPSLEIAELLRLVPPTPPL